MDKAIIYTGPSRAKLGLKKFAVYSNGLPEYISAMIEKHSELSQFFPAVTEFSLKGCISPGSEKYAALNELLNEIMKEAGE